MKTESLEPLINKGFAAHRILLKLNGNTYIYLISENDTLYRAKAASHEDMLLLKKGDNVHIAYSGKDIVTCEKQN